MKKAGIRQQAAAGMRALNMSSKFLVVFFGAKYLDLNEMAYLGLYWTVVTICASVIGLNIYTYTVRKVLNSGEQLVSREVSRHYSALVCFILVSAPILTLYSYSLFGEHYLIVVPILLLHVFAEVISQENSRFLIAFGKPFEASLANFVRGFVWSLLVVLYLIVSSSEASFLIIICIWLFFSFVSLGYSARLIQTVLQVKIKWEASFIWVVNSIRAAGWLLAASMLFRILVGGDRLIAEWILDESLLAVYVYYSILVFALVGIIEAGVSAWHYPELVKAVKAKSYYEVVERCHCYQIAVVKSAFAMIVLLNIIVFLTSKFFLDNIYFDNYLVFLILSMGVLAYSLAMPSHYVIYGAGRDRCYFIICGLSVVLFMMCASLLPIQNEIYRIAFAFLLTLTCFSVLKFLIAQRIRQALNNQV